MAEVDFSRLDHRQPLPQATANRVGPGWSDAVSNDRSDPVTHLPLHSMPAATPQPREPKPTPPSEQELRDKLAAALAEQHIADTALADAQAAYSRAQRHVERCGCDLDRYSDLDAAMTQATADMLREDAGEPHVHDALMGRTAERQRARLAYATAARAAELLQAELATARNKAAEAVKRTDRLVAGVLAFAAQSAAEQHERLLAEAAKVRETLLAFDHYVAGKGPGLLSQRVRGVLGNDMAAFAKRHDQSMWREAAAKLRQDPTCEVRMDAGPASTEV